MKIRFAQSGRGKKLFVVDDHVPNATRLFVGLADLNVAKSLSTNPWPPPPIQSSRDFEPQDDPDLAERDFADEPLEAVAPGRVRGIAS